MKHSTIHRLLLINKYILLLAHSSLLSYLLYKTNASELISKYDFRGMFDRQDSLRSDYMSDRESQRYGMVQQASVDSTDSRLCYLTSSEVSFIFQYFQY